MTDQSPKLPRKPFGYDPSVVDQMLADRDSMLALAERRVREAEGKAARLQEQVANREAALVELNEKIAAAPPEVELAPVATSAPDEEPLTPQFMTEELAKIITAAEASTSQILARARQSTRDQILEADRLWREVQTEVMRFSGWRAQAESALSGVQSAIDGARAQIEAVPDRVQGALAPAVEAMVRVDSQMAGFSASAMLPLLAAPSGLEDARARMDRMDSSAAETLAGLAAPPVEEPLEDDQVDEVEETPFYEASLPDAPPQEAVAGPTDSDWPSLGEPASLNSEDTTAEDATAVDAETLAEEASLELRQFQASRQSQGIESGAEDGSAMWGS